MATGPSHSQPNQQPEGDAAGRAFEHHFISYSRRDSAFVKRLTDELHKRHPRFRVWIDKNDMDRGLWTKQLENAIDTCSSFLLVVSEESNNSPVVAQELHRAHEDDKPIIPLVRNSEVKVPLLAGGYQYVDFSRDGDFDKSLAQLRKFLKAPGPRASVHQPPRLTGPAVINTSPLVVPTYFQCRDERYQLIEEFLSDDARALLWISGRAGSGKTSLACRVLERFRLEVWADPDRRIDIDAIAYVDQEQHSRSDWRKLFNELRHLIAAKGGAEPQKPLQGCSQTFQVQNLLTNLADRRIVLLIDHLDDLIDFETRNIRGQYLRDALQDVLTVTTHRLKVIVTSRVFPSDMQKVQEGRWLSLNLSEGLPQSEAMQLLRSLDQDGTAHLRDGEEKLLAEICRRTQGNPGAIEALHAVLRNDRTISLIDILRDEKGLLPGDVLHVLIGESYARLDVVSKTVMQVLSVSESPVTADAVVSLFHHYYPKIDYPKIDPRQVLSRLINMQLVQKRNDCYFLWEADRRYVLSQLADGKSSAKANPKDIHLDRFTLCKQHADYSRQLVSAGDPTAQAGSLTRQLEEFHLRYEGKDYAAATDVLKRLETPLLANERGQELAQCYEQLAGKLEDSKLVRHRLDTLARIYHRLGELDRSSAYYEEGLKCVRGKGDRNGQCLYLANLAICKQESGDLVGTTLYCMAALELARQTGDGAWEAHIWNIIGEALASLGQISAAMQASERALKLARDNLQREIEVVALANLGQHHEALNHDNQAQEECERACRIARAIGYQLGECAARRNLGTLKLSRRVYKIAVKDFTEAMQLADVTQSVQLQQTIRIELATALLLDSKLSEAEATVNEALRYDTLLFSSEAHSLRGVILQRQGKTREAAESFFQALKQAEAVLNRTPPYYRGLDAMGLSYSGLTLSEEADEYLDEAIGAYEAARLITNELGIVRRRLHLFEALAQVDSEKKLALARNAIDPAH